MDLQKFTPEQLEAFSAQLCKNTLMETLDISYCEVGEDYLVAKMPVTSKVYQPDGILHGGATVALAESVGSAAALYFTGQKFTVRGVEISANHVRSVREGFVYAKAKLTHKGKTLQLWSIEITDDAGLLVSLVKFTTMTLPKRS